MLGKNDCIGIAPDGITDPVATCRDAPEPLPEDPRPPRPACVIVPDRPGEQPLAGDAAFESLDGRGWDPRHCRLRKPILPLLLNLEGGQGVAESKAGNWLGAHVRALSPVSTARHIIAVPDRLGELGQQRLLDTLRRGNISVELLWRPIATVLGWACGLSAPDIDALNEKSVLVVHLGVWGPEVSRLDLEVEQVKENGGRWLVPIRNGRGHGLPVGQDWPIEQAAQRLLAADLARIGRPQDAVDSALVWLVRRPWAALCGESQPSEIVRDRAGCWQRLKGALPPSAEVAAMLCEPIQAMLHELAGRDQPVDRILIEGPLARLNAGSNTLGDQLAEMLRLGMGAVPASVEVLSVPSSTIARGAAHYGWRRRYGIPGYYDTVPDLLINACVNGRPEFVSLVEGQRRVPGGTTMPPKEDDRFFLAAGADRVEYYLARGDDLTVRKTETSIPEPPKEATKLVLVVRQTPGQGFAEVEVRTAERGQLGVRPVFLDWRLMDDTALTRDQVLKELSGQCTVAYPEPEPVECHAAVWRAYNLPSRISNFLDYMRRAGPELGPQLRLALPDHQGMDAVARLHKAMGAKPTAKSLRRTLARRNQWSERQLRECLPDEKKRFGAVNSEGEIPAEGDLVRLVGDPPAQFGSYRRMFLAVIQVTEELFANIPAGLQSADDLREKLLVLGAWCYTGAAPTIIKEIRSVLLANVPLAGVWQQRTLTAAGRCLSDSDDIAKFFRKIYRDNIIDGADVPEYRIVSVGQILAYRPDAPKCLTPETARGLAQIAIRTMEAQIGAPSRKFLSAAAMLMMLLRYRGIDPGFLSPSNQHHRPLLNQIDQILSQPLAANLKNRDKLEPLFKAMRDFIAGRGSPLPIYDPLTNLADPNDGD